MDASDAACIVIFDGDTDQGVTHAGNTESSTTLTTPVNEDFQSITATQYSVTTSSIFGLGSEWSYRVISDNAASVGGWPSGDGKDHIIGSSDVTSFANYWGEVINFGDNDGRAGASDKYLLMCPYEDGGWFGHGALRLTYDLSAAAGATDLQLTFWGMDYGCLLYTSDAADE